MTVCYSPHHCNLYGAADDTHHSPSPPFVTKSPHSRQQLTPLLVSVAYLVVRLISLSEEIGTPSIQNLLGPGLLHVTFQVTVGQENIKRVSTQIYLFPIMWQQFATSCWSGSIISSTIEGSSCLLATIQGSSHCPGGSYNLLFNGAFAVSSRKSLPHLRTRVSSPVELRIMGMGSTKFPRGSLVVSELHSSWRVLSWRKISVVTASIA